MNTLVDYVEKNETDKALEHVDSVVNHFILYYEALLISVSLLLLVVISLSIAITRAYEASSRAYKRHSILAVTYLAGILVAIIYALTVIFVRENEGALRSVLINYIYGRAQDIAPSPLFLPLQLSYLIFGIVVGFSLLTNFSALTEIFREEGVEKAQTKAKILSFLAMIYIVEEVVPIGISWIAIPIVAILLINDISKLE